MKVLTRRIAFTVVAEVDKFPHEQVIIDKKDEWAKMLLEDENVLDIDFIDDHTVGIIFEIECDYAVELGSTARPLEGRIYGAIHEATDL